VRAIISHAAAGKRFEMVVDACIFLEKQNLPFFFSQELPLICTQGSCATIRKR